MQKNSAIEPDADVARAERRERRDLQIDVRNACSARELIVTARKLMEQAFGIIVPDVGMSAEARSRYNAAEAAVRLVEHDFNELAESQLARIR